ncbi:MAG: transposase [Herpetosiphonaceae bacterium]|nr:transposase [Herpetosiphonaceae bacterium]
MRKWTCVVPTCSQRIFAERFPDVVQPYGRMTERTTHLLQTIGVITSGADAARVLAAIGLPTSAKTIIRRVLRLPLPPEGPVSAVGIDEWAWKKGNRYGTLVVDLEQQRVLTLLPERSVESATAWFQQHPDITIVSRDRGPIYRDAAQAAVPHAIHVADRFHLQKNFAEALERYFCYQVTHLRCAAAALTNQPTPSTSTLDPERVVRHHHRVAAHAEVWTLLRAGYGKEQIAR